MKKNPLERLGPAILENAGFRLEVKNTAVKQIEKLGFRSEQVKDCVISHFDPDHIGGLADFPEARVHASDMEYQAFLEGHARYRAQQLNYRVKLKTYAIFDTKWFNMDAVKLDLSIGKSIYFIFLPGHTYGNCGVAIPDKGKWLLYVGDAYLMRGELFDDLHPISELAALIAADNELRLKTLGRLRNLNNFYGDEVEIFGYHDSSEFPAVSS